MAKPAKFGHKEKTLYDSSVRNTLEIEGSSIHLDYNIKKWNAFLNDIRNALKLSPQVELSAHLHNLLIYEKGGLFKAHQDGEKLPGMIGTLVLVLPCPHIGGCLHIHNKENSITFSSENINSKAIQAVSFYADNLHSIDPVKDGHRIALTFNLVCHSSALKIEENKSHQEIDKALSAYFKGIEDISKQYLVVLLEHQYSQVGLESLTFKGLDEAYIQQLVNSMAKNNLSGYLTQIDYYEMYDGDDYYDEDELDFCSEDESYLIDSNFEIKTLIPLVSYLSESQQSLDVSIYVKPANVISFKPLRSYRPDDKEKTGWMGNYGNTSEYWYYRSAVLIYPKENKWYWAFKKDHKAALQDFQKFVKICTNKQEIKTVLHNVMEFIAPLSDESALQTKFSLMNYLEDEKIAKNLLYNFDLTSLTVKLIDSLDASIKIFGLNFIAEHIIPAHFKINDPENLVAIIDVMSKTKSKILPLILASLFKHLERHHPSDLVDTFTRLTEVGTKIDTASSEKMRGILTNFGINSINHSNLTAALTSLLLGAIRLELEPLLSKVLDVLDTPYIYPSHLRVQVIKRIYDLDNSLLNNPLIRQFLTNERKNIKNNIDATKQSLDTQSTNQILSCYCKDCKAVNLFLISDTETTYALKAVQDTRNHIEETMPYKINFCTYATIRKGSPHTLSISKNVTKLKELKNSHLDILVQKFNFLSDILDNE